MGLAEKNVDVRSWFNKNYWLKVARRINRGINYRIFLKRTGALNAVMLFVEFPNAPASEAPEGYRETEPYFRWLAPAMGWFKVSSYGRLNLTITPVHKCYRMNESNLEYWF